MEYKAYIHLLVETTQNSNEKPISQSKGTDDPKSEGILKLIGESIKSQL